ncbi:MAG TPA: hypothetical protein PKN75_11845 [Bacteroidia bacterium]|nr:hypothetical protein [Bacteroidia bacterium]HNU34270.1 hypothetical protein [Bacteroidia bacterium]
MFFEPRPIRFIELFECDNWKIKCYSISFDSSPVNDTIIHAVKSDLSKWLLESQAYSLPTYKIATLIIHKWSGGHFAVINWWIDKNMMQLFVYLAENKTPLNFKLYSDKGMVTCVWEMEILWFERNAWVEEVLKKELSETTLGDYLQKTLNKY